jgi:hypothetical protein
MGMLVPRERRRAHLDADVVVGLILDDAARTTVRQVRHDGYDVLLSPGVVHELAGAPRRVRRKLFQAALEYCTGFTMWQSPEILAREIAALESNELMPAVPYLPIRELADLQTEAGLIKRLGPFRNTHDKKQDIEALERIAREIRSHPLEPTFEEFLASWTGPIGSLVIRGGVEKGTVKAPDFRNTQDFAKYDKHGLVTVIALLAASLYRRTRNLGKGEGCLSDLGNMVEVAHADIVLTRDKELAACGDLVRSVLEGGRVEIRLVPRPDGSPSKPP